MNIKTILAFLSVALLACVPVHADPPSLPSGGGPGGESGGGPGGESGGGGSGGSFTCDSVISVTTNAYCLVREGVLFGYTSSLSTSVAPTAAAGVTELAHGVFAGNTSITTVNLANTSIAEIPSDCFAGCTALKTVTLPSICTSIGPGAFAGCTALATFTGTGVSAVSHDAFRGCTSLAAAAGADEIGSYAYSQSGVASADVSSATTLGEGVFAGCESLTTATVASSATLPAAVFAGCTSLAVSDWSGVSEFGQASLAGIPATSLTISAGAAVGAYAFAADAATVATTLSALPASYDADTSFLGREASYTVNGSDVVRIEANELVTWLMAVAETPLESTAVAQPTSDGTTVCYATASLESWLADASNEAALLAYCYGDGTAATDVLAVDGGTQAFVFEPSDKSAISVTVVGTNDLAVDFDAASLSGTDNGDGTYTYVSADDTATSCFARLKFAKDW